MESAPFNSGLPLKRANDYFVEFDRYYRSGNRVKIEFFDPIGHEIVATKAFQRLADVSFLGAISYVRSLPSFTAPVRESRFEHSIGVARLADRLATRLKLLSSERKLILVAALLHDIGHPPLSHSAELAFKQRLGFDHHEYTIEVISGRTPMGRPVRRILESHSIDIESVIDILSGAVSFYGYSLFNGPFNLDTLEGISRCYAYRLGRVSPGLPPPDVVLSAAINPDPVEAPPILDCFWRMKGHIYSEFIRSENGVIADYIANSYLANRRRTLALSDLEATDRELRKKHPKLFDELFLFDKLPRLQGKAIEYTEREFVIDERFSETDPERRYRQRKKQGALEVGAIR